MSKTVALVWYRQKFEASVQKVQQTLLYSSVNKTQYAYEIPFVSGTTTTKFKSLLLCHPVKEKLTEYIRTLHSRQILLASGAGPSASLGERGSDKIASLADCTLPVVSWSENWRQEKFNRY